MRFSLTTASLSIALLASSSASASDPPVRPEQRESDQLPPSSVRLPLVLGGLAFTTGWWGAGAGSAFLAGDDPAWNELKKPIIGPFRAIGAQSCDDCGFLHYFSYPWFAFLGLAQVGGLGVALEGLIVPTRSGGSPNPVRQSPVRPETMPSEEPGVPSRPETPTSPSKPMFFIPAPVPMGKGGVGLSIGGMF